MEAIKVDAGPYYTVVQQLAGNATSMLPQRIVDAVRRMRRAGDGAIQTSRRATKSEHDIAVATGNAREGTPYYVTETTGRLTNISAISAAETLRSTMHDLEPALAKLDTSDVEVMSEKDARSIDRLTTGIDSRLDQLQSIADALKAFAAKDNVYQLAKLLESSADKQAFNAFLAALPGVQRERERA